MVSTKKIFGRSGRVPLHIFEFYAQEEDFFVSLISNKIRFIYPTSKVRSWLFTATKEIILCPILVSQVGKYNDNNII